MTIMMLVEHLSATQILYRTISFNSIVSESATDLQKDKIFSRLAVIHVLDYTVSLEVSWRGSIRMNSVTNMIQPTTDAL